jgi:multisubunit Na+/H+ antiporter MnhB subunit
MTGDTPILRTVARFAVPLTVIVSVVIFFQGHNMPGGGFIAGVLAAAAGAIHLLGFGVDRARNVAWWKLPVVGLIISLLTGTIPMIYDRSFMDHTIWYIGSFHLPTATFFDVGVYMIVFGTLMTIFVELAQEEGV